jgi:hypothetical protein
MKNNLQASKFSAYNTLMPLVNASDLGVPVLILETMANNHIKDWRESKNKQTFTKYMGCNNYSSIIELQGLSTTPYRINIK